MSVIGGPFGLTMASRGWPIAWQIIQAVPVDTFGTPAQQLGSAVQAKDLHLLGPERGGPGFGDPHRERRDGLNFLELVRPFVNAPVIPIQWEAMHGDDIEVLEHALVAHIGNKHWVNG